MKKSAVNPNDYEIYEYPENYEEVLIGHLGTIEENEPLADKPVSEAVWILESGLNLVYMHPLLEFESLEVTTKTYFMPLSQELVDGEDISDNFLDVYAEVENSLSASGNKSFLTVDVRVVDITHSMATVDVDIAYALNAVVLPPTPACPCDPLPAVGSREACTDEFCGTASGPTGDDPTYQYNANNAMVGYNRNYAYKWGATNSSFHQNVISYGSTNQNNTISSAELFGNPQSRVSAYSTLSAANTCLSANEQDQYIDAIHDNIFSLAGGKSHKVILAKTTRFDFGFSGALWLYDDVKVGEYMFAVEASFTFEPML